MDTDAGVAFGEHGEVTLGEGFREGIRVRLDGWNWSHGSRRGRGASTTMSFYLGAAFQGRLRAHLDGLSVVWVGVHCDAEVAAGREFAHGDRVVGGAASQATRVHEGVSYDLEIDTTSTESPECAHVASRGTCPKNRHSGAP